MNLLGPTSLRDSAVRHIKFYGGGWSVLEAQLIGSAIICVATFACAMAMFAALNAVGLLRVTKEGELMGLDVDQHGINAYPEYEISGGSMTGSAEMASLK